MVACESVCALAHRNSELVEIDECSPGTPYTLSGKLLNAYSLFKKPCHHMICFFCCTGSVRAKNLKRNICMYLLCATTTQGLCSLSHFCLISLTCPLICLSLLCNQSPTTAILIEIALPALNALQRHSKHVRYIISDIPMPLSHIMQSLTC